MIAFGKFPTFVFGLVFSSSGFEFFFGWNSFKVVWKNILETLPEMAKLKCGNCGTEDWTAANTTEDGKGISDCNKCGGYAGGPQ
jgi:hypothetical protein